MGDILEWVLHNKQPQWWDWFDKISYSPYGYIQVEIHECVQYDEWHDAVGNSFPYLSISEISRIQHLPQLALFEIQKEKRKNENSDWITTRGYHVVHPQDVTIALRFPLDYRRYRFRKNHLQNNGKHPLFFPSLQEAYESGRYELQSENGDVSVIVCDRFYGVRNQGDYLPLYLVTLSN